MFKDMQLTLNKMVQSTIQMVLPDPCRLCGGAKCHSEAFICTSCFLNLPRELNRQGHCQPLALKFQGLLLLESSWAYLKFHRGNSVQRLLHALKYGDLPQLGFVMGNWMAAELFPDHQRHYVIVPVPQHFRKLKSRGYNQSLEIAKGISQITGWPVENYLYRTMLPSSQTALNRWQRYSNTQNQFALRRHRQLRNSRVLLVDDVVTTGATMVACARCLMRAGAAVGVAALALTQEH